MRLLSLAFVFLALITTASAAAPPRYLIVWGMETTSYPGDMAGHDFLAVFDINDPEHFGQLVSMVPVPQRSMMAHHANYDVPQNNMLFANDFMAAQSFVFDLRNPLAPRLASSFTDAGPYTHPHSFAYLSNGHTLATYQYKGHDDTAAGALVELDGSGHMLRASDAADPAVEPFIRPYSLIALENIDRAITTSADMMPSPHDSHVVQVWRLSDLKLLKTVVLPAPQRFKGVAGQDADEARVLSDGKTVIVQTTRCGLYKMNDVAGSNPTADFIYDFGYRSCSGVPIVVGNYWIESSISGHCVTALDMSDPLHPVEVSRLALGADAYPHWLGAEPNGNEFAITGFGSLLNRISFASIDRATGKLELKKQSIPMTRDWPDGWKGAAVPHAALFYEK